MQPDTIIPNLYNPQDLNRFSYVRNNPIRYNDPTGHMICAFCDGEGGNLTPLQKAIDAQKLAVLEHEAERRKKEKKSEEPSEPFDGLSYCALESYDSTDCNRNYKLNMYYEIGYPDIGELAIHLPYRNPLAEAYDLSYWYPEFVSNKTDLNVNFLIALGVDHQFYPNYETIYLDALKTKNSRVYDDIKNAVNNVNNGLDPILNILLDESIYWPLYDK